MQNRLIRPNRRHLLGFAAGLAGVGVPGLGLAAQAGFDGVKTVDDLLQSIEDRLVQEHQIEASRVDGKPGTLSLKSLGSNDSWSFDVTGLVDKLAPLDKAEQEIVIDSQIRRMLAKIDDGPLKVEEIVLALRHIDYMGKADKQMVIDASKNRKDPLSLKTQHPFLPMFGDLVLIYLRYTPYSEKIITRDMAQAVGVSPRDLFSTAAQNVNKIARTTVSEIVDGGLLRLTFKDAPRLNSVILLWNQLLRKSEKNFGSDYLLVYPSAAEGVHIARRADPQAADKLRAVIARAKRAQELSVTPDVLESTLIYEREDNGLKFRGMK